jgi:Asp/Glu/hydantoin racemase
MRNHQDYGGELLHGGKNMYGHSIGVLMLQTRFPRIPGDMGNAYTWDFPVLYKVVEGASVARVVEESDPTLLKPFIEAAQELVLAGVSAITTTCGFLAMFQGEMAAAVDVPVFTSALLMAPMVHRMLGPSRKIGVLSVNASALNERQFIGAGIEKIPCVCAGLEKGKHFINTFGRNGDVLDVEGAREEIRLTALQMVEENPDVGAIILECANMPPFAADIRRATNRPVFDIVTLVNFMQHALVKPEYRGAM